MSVRSRLLLLVVLVATVPLAIASSTALRIQARAQERQLRELFARSADFAAAAGGLRLDGTLEGLELLATKTVSWSELTPEERAGAVWLVYRQADEVTAASLVNSSGGGLFTARLAPAEDAGDPALSGHARIDVVGLESFARALPFDLARANGSALGPAFTIDGDRSPQLAVAHAVDGAGGERWVLAVAVSLRTVCEEVARAAGGAREALLLDEGGRVLCGPTSVTPLAPLDPVFRDALHVGRDDVVMTTGAVEGTAWLAARRRMPQGWTAVVREPAAVAFAATGEIRRRSMLWLALSLLSAIGAGLLLSRGINRSVAKLEHGAGELAKGRFGHRIGSIGQDELGRLAAAFDSMAREVESRDAEIRRFNDELQQRVDERTRELEETQAALLQSEKLSAISTLGAGMAHEINNPLTGILGLAQVLRMRSAKSGDESTAKSLERLEAEAKRIKGIVLRLTSLAESRRREGFLPVQPAEVLASVLESAGPELSRAGITVEREWADVPEVRARRADLQQVLLELLTNARIALSKTEGPRRIQIRLAADEKMVRISVTDNGKGIATEYLEKVFEPFFTTKEEWTGKGLGLAVAFRIVQEHNGAIRASSQGPGRGATFTLLPPVARRVTSLD